MDNKKKWYISGAIVIILLLFLFVGHVKKNGGLMTPKTVSFAKTSGERIWYGTDGGKGKDAIIDCVDVTKGNKMIEYQIFDDDITLGKVSKMSNGEVIKLAKKQDRKYFDKSIDEVKSLRDGNKQIGSQNDMWGDDDLKGDLNKGPFLYFVAQNKDGAPKLKGLRLVTKNNYNTANSSGDGQYCAKYTESELIDYGTPANANRTETTNKMLDYSRSQRLSALINNMKSVKYLAPKYQTISIKNTTDDTGNKVVSQRVNYKSIDEFNDSGTIDKNVNSLSQTSKEKIEKFWENNYDNNRNESSEEFINNFKSAFDSSYYNQITKNLFHPHTFEDNFTISDPVSQTIYSSRFIGYAEGNDCYLLTKAQNKTQKAVLSK